jgi:NTP pyrophosphatase (non-canonical NTP hydrolase)
MLADELADVFLYLDLLAWHYGIDLPRSIVSKFNRVSAAQGFPEELPWLSPF